MKYPHRITLLNALRRAHADAEDAMQNASELPLRYATYYRDRYRSEIRLIESWRDDDPADLMKRGKFKL